MQQLDSSLNNTTKTLRLKKCFLDRDCIISRASLLVVNLEYVE